MTTLAKRRRGRPPKKVTREKKRYPLGLIVSAKIKRIIDERAKRDAKTQSRIAEELVDQALHTEHMLRTLNVSLEQMDRAKLETELRRRNWKCDEIGRWSPPELHGLQPGGFQPEGESELQPVVVEIEQPQEGRS
jgi:hypothetical protein